MERSNRILGKQEVAAKKAPQKGAFENGKKADARFDPTRRRILKATLLGLTGAAVGAFDRKIRETELLGDYVKDKLEGRLAKKSSDMAVEKKEVVPGEETSEEKVPEDPAEAIEQKITKEDSASLREIISFNSREPINLGEGEVERLKKYWEKRYEGDKKGDLEGALGRLKNWEHFAKEAFMQVGREHCLHEIQPEKRQAFLEKFEECFYLSIPESYWDLEANSGVAVGPFQFTSKTANTFDLKKGANFDERLDPIKSAKAAARCLIDLYKNMNHDWRLVLSGYNGGFVWKFKKEAVANNKDLNYTNFLKYLAKKIEKLKQELLFAKTLTHEVLKGDTPEKIATMYGMTVKQLKDMNKYKKLDSLEPEDKLVIIPTMQNRQKNFYYHIEGFSQNINYPAKLEAVLVVLRKKEREAGRTCFDQKSNLPDWKEETVKQENPYFSHVVTSKDTLSGLAKKYAISMTEICQKNKLKKPYLLSPGESLSIRNTKKPITLAALAPAGKLEAMKRINPAIKNASEPLPNGFAIRRLSNSGEKYLAVK